MEITSDDNFFIEEPQKLRNSFFNSDKSLQIVELLRQKHNSNSSINSAKNSLDLDENIDDIDDDLDEDDDTSSGSPISGSSTTADKKNHHRPSLKQQQQQRAHSQVKSSPSGNNNKQPHVDARIRPCLTTAYMKQIRQQHAQLQNQLHQQHQNSQLTQEQKEELLSQYQKQQTQLQQQSRTLPLSSQQRQQLLVKMPRSIIARLDLLCQVIHSHATSVAAVPTPARTIIRTRSSNKNSTTTPTATTGDSGDLNLLQQTVETLVNASKSGCCFLERYIVMILNVCTRNLIEFDRNSDNEPMRLKVMELLNKVLYVKFDRQQLIENFRKPEYKLTSIEQIIQLLRIVQATLDYREQVAIDWLAVILDAYFVEVATTEEAVEIIDQISAHIDFQCALLRQTESSKCILDSIIEQLSAQDNDKDVIDDNTCSNREKESERSSWGKKRHGLSNPVHDTKRKRPRYTTDSQLLI